MTKCSSQKEKDPQNELLITSHSNIGSMQETHLKHEDIEEVKVTKGKRSVM